MIKTVLIFPALLATLFLGGCPEEQQSSDSKMRQQQERLSAEAASQVGMPAIVNFQEKRMMKQIIELRDQTISTVTYIVDFNGKLHKVCDSVGYGLPYATQYTNPQKIAASNHQVGYAILPQADPNGLFSPTSADGTWVMCLNPANKDELKPIFIEPRVITSPFPLNVN